MECFRMRQSYSYIGDLTDFLIQNEQRIKNLMIDYEIQSKIDTLQDGREVKSLMFTKQNVTVRFLPNRIDYTYALPTPTTDPNVMYNAAKEYFKLFSEIFYNVEAQRVAIVSQGFIKNENNEAIADFHSKMGLTSVFGMSNELHFKINNPKTLYEPINSVLNVDMGEAKNNKTQETMKVLLVSIDVNTLASNTTPRFNPIDFEGDFKELYDEVEDKHRCLGIY
ncbi:MAG: hypothetical protein NC310_06720 [Roseburia sp.]|nr:hypothetical protein [Anaeroplasma bactoclasticum]MCM1196742.1 hypothetical protein [Roseburia sp.]MCM1557500.1 hypothetical protein [Anaeroplasma bactoclasticum]